MPHIKSVYAMEVFDSRGNPTVEAVVQLTDGKGGRAISPSGASTGKFEACELRDIDSARLGGKGVQRAVRNVNELIAPACQGHDVLDQSGLDRLLQELDGTENKTHLGANAILAVSLAAAHAGAEHQDLLLYEHIHKLYQNIDPSNAATPKMPLPMVNMISGGLHARGKLDFQDFLAVPIGASTFSEALTWIVELYHRLGSELQRQGFESTLVGDEGGYGPDLASAEQACQIIVDCIEQVNLRPGIDIAVALDVASSRFCNDNLYRLSSPALSASSSQFVELLCQLCDQFPIISIEDGCDEEDWDGWQDLSMKLRSRIQLLGDDLFVTNSRRLKRGIEGGIANAVLIKCNQIGTLSETLEVMKMARHAGYNSVVSARSGETEDVTIAHLAVGTGAGQIKIGSVARSERLAKYNELLRIERQLESPRLDRLEIGFR